MRANPQDASSFDFEGRAIPMAAGMTIAAALTAAGELALKHDRQGGRRGVFCGMGVCQECLVTVEGRPLRACMTAAQPGVRVVRSPALANLDQVPRARRQGDPRASAEPTDERSTPAETLRSCDLLVIGGGPAGLSAAAVAAEAGLDVVIVDERAKLGGQYFKQPSGPGREPSADAQFAAGRALIQRALAAGVEVHSDTSVWGAFGLDAIRAISPDGGRRYACKGLVLAPGAYERGVPFPGWTLPGVMTTGAAQTLWRSHGVAPGERVLISGNGPLNMQVAAELTAAGARIVAVAEVAAAPTPARVPALIRMALADPGLVRAGLAYRATLARARVPVMYGAAVTRVEGDGRARSAVVTPVSAGGRRGAGGERRFAVDAVCLGFGFVPSTEIARSLGCRHEYATDAGHLVTAVDGCGATSVERVWVVGDGGGIRGARHDQVQGELAACDALRTLYPTGSGSPPRSARAAARAAARHRRFQDALTTVYAAPIFNAELADPETELCRCEGVTRRAVERALAAGAGHAGAIKRETRAGMGPCQGRYCGPVIAAMVASSAGEAPGELSGYAPSPPTRPVEIEALLRATD